MSTRKKMPPYRGWGSTLNGTIEFESLTTETLKPGLDLIRNFFFRDEVISKCVNLYNNLAASEELLELCVQAAKDGVSVVAIDVSNNEVAGVAFNKIQVLGNPDEISAFEKFRNSCEYESSKGLVDFMIDADKRINFFEHYNVDCILEIMFLVTAPHYRGQRIGELLAAASIEIGHELNRGQFVKVPVNIEGKNCLLNADNIPKLCSMIATSPFTLKIAEKFGFTRHVDISLDDFEYQGKKFSEIVDNNLAVLLARKIM